MSLATSALPIKVIFLFLALSLCACCNWLPAISFPNQRVQWTLNWIVAHGSPLDQCIRLTCKMIKPLSSRIYRLTILVWHGGGPDKWHFPFLHTVAWGCGHLWVSQFQTYGGGGGRGEVTLLTAKLLLCSHPPFFLSSCSINGPGSSCLGCSAKRHLRKILSSYSSKNNDLRTRCIIVSFWRQLWVPLFDSSSFSPLSKAPKEVEPVYLLHRSVVSWFSRFLIIL